MGLPVEPPLSPMLAKATTTVPEGDGWLFEPKFDGFRCLVFRDGDQLLLASRNERPFNRYFPELLEPLAAQLPLRCVLDGEIVVPSPRGVGLDFDALQQRIHPAESRVRRLAGETPARLVAFDLLALDDESLLEQPLEGRRAALVDVLRTSSRPLHLGPATTDHAIAQRWFTQFEGAGLDGVVAKRLDGRYTPGERTLVKVKHERTADCVVAGYRWHKDGNGIGSVLLGLYDDNGKLHHVGVAASFTAKQRRELVDVLRPLEEHALDDHPWREWALASAHEGTTRLPGAPSRWNATKDMSWTAVRPERVVEVRFTQLEAGRLRHNGQVARWRTDRTPQSCTYAQLDVATKVAFDELLAEGTG